MLLHQIRAKRRPSLVRSGVLCCDLKHTTMKIFIIIIFIIIGICSSGFLNSRSIEVVICDQPFFLEFDSVVIKCDPPLERKRASASIHILTKGKYRFHKSNEFMFEDGTSGKISISLINSKGVVIDAPFYGNAGNSMAGNFSDIPKSMSIKSVMISSTKKLQIEKVVWHQFDPV